VRGRSARQHAPQHGEAPAAFCKPCELHGGPAGARPSHHRAAGRNGAAALKRARRGAAELQWETSAIPSSRFAVGAALPGCHVGCTPRTARRQPRFACHVGCIGALPVFTAGHGRPIARAAGRNGAATLKKARLTA
jgi:hypothetical protein